MNIAPTSASVALQDHPAVMAAYMAYLSRNALQASGPRLAACGIYNAGKSSLLNVLADRFMEGGEAFRTGAARVTSDVSELEVGGVTLVDMPGVDGVEEDDQTAWQGVLGGDCYLYVHRLMAREFEQSELDFLHALKAQVSGLESRIALVISQIDEVGDVAEAARRQTAIRATFAAAVGFEPRWTFAVSVARFKKGSLEGKQGLVRISGVPELKEWVNQLAEPSASVDWRSFRADRLRTDKDVLVSQIHAIVDDLDLQLLSRKAAHLKRVSSFELATTALVGNIRDSIARINAAD